MKEEKKIRGNVGVSDPSPKGSVIMTEGSKERDGDGFKLEVPLDASRIKDFKPDMAIKVMLVDRKGKTYSIVTKLDKEGKGVASFKFSENPGDLRLVLGPENATEEELLGLQTINLNVPVDKSARELKLKPILIPPYYWDWWHWWCRTFTITGRVLCPDGNPVPGATVCAYDVDLFWWWSSKEKVGCDTTDATGSFEITFRWCCNFWPWWWWKRRFWQIEPPLIDLIMPVLQRDPKLPKLPSPEPKPDFAIFERLLAEDGVVMHRSPKEDLPNLDELRGRLLKRIPVVAGLERLHIWPWWPWRPWWDCTPDIIFKVTQNCMGQEKVIVNEGVWDTRWNIPTSLNVTLTASNEACCISIPNEPPEGNCMVFSHACGTLVKDIGGNPGAPAAPVGYVNPGVRRVDGDRPYAGEIDIFGVFGHEARIDYYEFEWSQNLAGPWNPMPPGAAGGFTRLYWEQVPPPSAGPEDWHSVPFNFVSISGRNVVESREHFEANNAPASWGITRFWVYNRDLLMRWLTENTFSDGTYYLRIKGWNLDREGNLVNGRILPLCGTRENNYIVLTIDNRYSIHPSTPDHPCGSGTVHLCTLEPDTDFLSVKIIRGGSEIDIEACGNERIQEGDTLRIDFMAYDPDGHLSYYTLRAIYRENLAVNLLTLGVPVPLGGHSVPAAAQVGPSYGNAIDQGAVAPVWKGGAMRLEIPAMRAFPETCCYQLELIAHKRTIVNCNYSLWNHINTSTYSIGIMR